MSQNLLIQNGKDKVMTKPGNFSPVLSVICIYSLSLCGKFSQIIFQIIRDHGIPCAVRVQSVPAVSSPHFSRAGIRQNGMNIGEQASIFLCKMSDLLIQQNDLPVKNCFFSLNRVTGLQQDAVGSVFVYTWIDMIFPESTVKFKGGFSEMRQSRTARSPALLTRTVQQI